MDFKQLSAEALLGPLNDVEKKHAPKTLHVAGDAVLARAPSVSIVGSRKATVNGLRRAERRARILVDRGLAVVSGLAEGIDTAVHEAAIDHGGRTIAVLGTPLDEVYPRKNEPEQESLADNTELFLRGTQAGPVPPPGDEPQDRRRHSPPARVEVNNGEDTTRTKRVRVAGFKGMPRILGGPQVAEIPRRGG